MKGDGETERSYPRTEDKGSVDRGTGTGRRGKGRSEEKSENFIRSSGFLIDVRAKDFLFDFLYEMVLFSYFDLSFYNLRSPFLGLPSLLFPEVISIDQDLLSGKFDLVLLSPNTHPTQVFLYLDDLKDHMTDLERLSSKCRDTFKS